MKSEPTDKVLYEKIKRQVYKKMPTHSAYRSGHLVQQYKKAFRKKHGDKSPYSGSSKPLKRWFEEEWRTQDGSEGYTKKGDIFRPTKRVNEKTPTTMSELSAAEIKAAQTEKRLTGRVKRFRFPAGMKEKILGFQKGPRGKKYKAFVVDSAGKRRTISFGSSSYEHYKDSTGVGMWSRKDHGDKSRQRSYFLRHSGESNKQAALKKEIQKSKGRFNARILSHKFLW